MSSAEHLRRPAGKGLGGAPGRIRRRVSGLLLLASVLTAAACCLPTRLRYGVVPTPRPLWKTDLRPLGFYVDDFSPTGVITAVDQIAFGSNDELVVLSSDDADLKKPNPVQAYVLDTLTGRVVKEATWTARLRPSVFATARGRYVVDTFEGLALYAPGLDQILASFSDQSERASTEAESSRYGTPSRGTP